MSIHLQECKVIPLLNPPDDPNIKFTEDETLGLFPKSTIFLWFNFNLIFALISEGLWLCLVGVDGYVIPEGWYDEKCDSVFVQTDYEYNDDELIVVSFFCFREDFFFKEAGVEGYYYNGPR